MYRLMMSEYINTGIVFEKKKNTKPANAMLHKHSLNK